MLAELAGALALAAFVPYLVGILKGQIQPKLSSWFVFATMDVLTLVGVLNMDPRPAIFVPLGFTIGAVSVFLLALTKNRDRSLSRLDKISLSFAAVGLALFVVTGDGLFGVLAGLAAMLVGAIPTIMQLWREPEKEGFWAWVLFGLSAIANLFASENHTDFQTFVFPLVIAMINIPVMMLVFRGRFILKRT